MVSTRSRAEAALAPTLYVGILAHETAFALKVADLPRAGLAGAVLVTLTAVFLARALALARRRHG